MAKSGKTTVLLISQVFVPDTPSVGQHLYDLSRDLVASGKKVIVLTSRGGYDDPSVKFPRREVINGIEVRRLPLCAFGKKPIILRLIGGISLVLQSMIRGVFFRGLNVVLVSTVPPMSGLAARFIGVFRRIRIIYWAMDLNPDQMIVSNRLSERSLIAKISEWINRIILSRTDCVVALDDFMAERLKKKANLRDKLSIIPPWPYDEQLADISHDENPFRKKHILDDRFVVMYSGNITDIHPIDTLMEAICRLKNDKRIIFLFIGSKTARERIDDFAKQNGISNIKTLSYVPLEETRYSLSAADLHVVTMGDNMVGVVHPCKIYGILSVGRPFLAISPRVSHIGEIAKNGQVGWIVEHGNVEGVLEALDQARTLTKDELKIIGHRCRQLIIKKYSRESLSSKFAKLIDSLDKRKESLKIR